jgi:hypothetical protein
VRSPLVDGGDVCAGAIAGYAFDLGWITIAPRIAACREHARNAFVATMTDDLTADARVGHAWRLGRFELGAQVEIGGGMLHQTFSTTGNAPARVVATALFGGGGRAAIELGHGAWASLTGELDTFVFRHDDRMSAGWAPTLAATALVGLEWTR